MALMARLFLILAVMLGAFPGGVGAMDEIKNLELRNALGQVKLFSGMTGKERAALNAAAGLRHSQEGERIIEQGKPLDRMFIILEGKAEIWVDGKIMAILPPQSLVGDIEFLDGLPASADVYVLKNTRLVELNNARLNTLMEERPRLGYQFMREIAKIGGQRLRAMNKK